MYLGGKKIMYNRDHSYSAKTQRTISTQESFGAWRLVGQLVKCEGGGTIYVFMAGKSHHSWGIDLAQSLGLLTKGGSVNT